MPVKYFCPHWGNTLSFQAFCIKVKKAGFDGIEMDISPDPVKKERQISVLKEYDLLLIGQYWQSLEKKFIDHTKNYKAYLYHLAACQPVLINAQTGKDYFSFEQNMALLKVANKISKETGVPILHETHRGKFLYNIPVFTRAAAKDTKLGITLDISHWCNVHESYLEDQAPAVQKALTHTRHLHARIGHTQSAQVNDPRAPEWKDTVQKFYSWWDKLLLLQSKKNKPFTITTEFGPFPYMPEAPYTRKALADQWELNVFMLKILQNRYKHI